MENPQSTCQLFNGDCLDLMKGIGLIPLWTYLLNTKSQKDKLRVWYIKKEESNNLQKTSPTKVFSKNCVRLS